MGSPNYSKGEIKNDRAKLFWVIANGETQDHKVLLRGSEPLFTRRTAQHWDRESREGAGPLPKEHCRPWAGLS